MLRSGLLCLAWLLASGPALAQSPPAQPGVPPAATPAATTPVQRPDPPAAAKPQPPTPATSSTPAPTPPTASAPGRDPARKVRLHVTVDVIDPSRDVRDIISEMRARRPGNAERPQPAPDSPPGARQRAPMPAVVGRELREERSARREQRRERREVRQERLEHRQEIKARPGIRSERPGSRRPER